MLSSVIGKEVISPHRQLSVVADRLLDNLGKKIRQFDIF